MRRSTPPATGWPWSSVERNKYADDDATAPAATTPLMKLRRENPVGVSSLIALPSIPDGLFDGELPIHVARFDHDIKDVGILLNVADAAAGAGMIDDLLQRAAADRAVGGQTKRAGVGRLGRRFPAHAQRAGVARKRSEERRVGKECRSRWVQEH